MKLITLTNDGYTDYTQNLIFSLNSIGIKDLKIYCVGIKSYNYFKKQNLEVELVNKNLLSGTNKFKVGDLKILTNLCLANLK